MASLEYTSRVVDVRHLLNTIDGDSWISAPSEVRSDRLMLTAAALAVYGMRPLRVGESSFMFLTYSGYIAGVKTAIQLAETNVIDALEVRLSNRLTGELVDTWVGAVYGERPVGEEVAVHGVFGVFQGWDGLLPDPVITTPAGTYDLDIYYINPSSALESTIISGLVEILPAVPA